MPKSKKPLKKKAPATQIKRRRFKEKTAMSTEELKATPKTKSELMEVAERLVTMQDENQKALQVSTDQALSGLSPIEQATVRSFQQGISQFNMQIRK